MRKLTAVELERVHGGLRMTDAVGRVTPLMAPGSPPRSPVAQINGSIDWTNVTSSISSWYGNSSGNETSSSFNFFAPANQGITFFVSEGNGFADVSVATPSFENDTPIPIGGPLQLTPTSSGFMYGLRGTFTLGSDQITTSGGFYTNPNDPAATRVGLSLDVKF